MLHGRPARTNSMTTEQAPPLPLHVEETVATIAALHAAHYREARALQKAVSKATRGIAQPAMLIVSTVAIAGWIMLNLASAISIWSTPRSTHFRSHCCQLRFFDAVGFYLKPR